MSDTQKYLWKTYELDADQTRAVRQLIPRDDPDYPIKETPINQDDWIREAWK